MKAIQLSSRSAILMMAVLFSCLTLTAQAKDQKPQKNRGPIIAVDTAANTITLDHKKKGELTLTLSPDVKVKPKSVGGLSGLKPGMFVICYSPPEGGDVQAIRYKPKQ